MGDIGDSSATRGRRSTRREGVQRTAVSAPSSAAQVIDLTGSSPPPGSSSKSPTSGNDAAGIAILPANLTIATTGLSRASHSLLLKKQAWLRNYTIEVPRDMVRNGLAHCVEATLVFGQEEAGTAVCVSSAGRLLTCSHCVAESEAELDGRSHWLVFASGQIVEAKCIAWDGKRDLALLEIIAAQAEPFSPDHCFPYILPSDASPPLNARLICVGHPGSEDLEADIPGIKTNYDVLHLSMGAYRGLAEGQDVHDNENIGALMHSCWTYWGHSGAPILERRHGKLVGLHSSWDEQTGMRRGVALEAILSFLELNKQPIG